MHPLVSVFPTVPYWNTKYTPHYVCASVCVSVCISAIAVYLTRVNVSAFGCLSQVCVCASLRSMF